MAMEKELRFFSRFMKSPGYNEQLINRVKAINPEELSTLMAILQT